MKGIDEILQRIPDEEREQLLDILQIIEDPLSRDILGKLASPHSPIFANNIPVGLFKSSKIDILYRLKKMSDKQIVKSEFETSQGGIAYKKYDLTEYGRGIANTHAKSEIEKHSQLLRKVLHSSYDIKGPTKSEIEKHSQLLMPDQPN